MNPRPLECRSIATFFPQWGTVNIKGCRPAQPTLIFLRRRPAYKITRTPTQYRGAAGARPGASDVVVGMLKDHTELFKQFAENPSFKKWLSDTIFGATYEGAGV